MLVFIPRKWLPKLYKKMTKKDRARIAKAKADKKTKAMVIKTINKKTGKVNVSLGCI